MYLPILTAITLATSTGALQEETAQIEALEIVEDCTDCVDHFLEDTRAKLAEVSHDNQEVLDNFEQFAEILNLAYKNEKSMTAPDVQEICFAVEFAAHKHRLQTRKNPEKTPYICHPIGVAFNVMSVGEVRDVAIIIGALLHDTVEDTQTTFEEIEKNFNKTVADLVREMTDNKSLAKESRKRLQVIQASRVSAGAAQIKLADKLYNLNDLLNCPPDDWTEARIDNYYEWASSVVSRLPKVNGKLSKAIEETINTYWESQ